MTDFEKQMAFIMELDKIKKITRQTYLSDGSRKENDAEHSWHLALMAFVFADYANEKIDVLKTMKMVLLHDVIEIDAGDTYAYDTEGNKTKRERELKAADRIFGLLPDAQCMEYRGLWDEFEAMETAEAKFANMLDKVQPLLLNNASDGKSWVEHGVFSSRNASVGAYNSAYIDIVTGIGMLAFGINFNLYYFLLMRRFRDVAKSEELWAYAKSLIEENVKKGRLQP